MMRILNLLAMLAAVTSPGDNGVILWGNLRAGMSRTDVKSKFTSRAIVLGAACVARINWSFKSGLLDEVRIDSIDDNPSCKTLAITSLYQKYGAPVSTNSAIKGGDCPTNGAGGKICAAFGGNDVYRRDVITWLNNGVIVEFNATSNSDSWVTAYRAQEHTQSVDLNKF